MNYRRAAATAGASVTALLMISAAAFLCFITTFDMSPFASGPSPGERLLWLILLPAAAAAGTILIAKSSGDVSSRRMVLSVVVVCTLAILWVASGPASSPNSPTGEEQLSVQFALLWASASYAVIATVRIPEMARRKAGVIYALSAVTYVAGLVLVNADFGGPSLLASFATWIFLPAAAASVRT